MTNLYKHLQLHPCILPYGTARREKPTTTRVVSASIRPGHQPRLSRTCRCSEEDTSAWIANPERVMAHGLILSPKPRCKYRSATDAIMAIWAELARAACCKFLRRMRLYSIQQRLTGQTEAESWCTAERDGRLDCTARPSADPVRTRTRTRALANTLHLIPYLNSWFARNCTDCSIFFIRGSAHWSRFLRLAALLRGTRRSMARSQGALGQHIAD